MRILIREMCGEKHAMPFAFDPAMMSRCYAPSRESMWAEITSSSKTGVLESLSASKLAALAQDYTCT